MSNIGCEHLEFEADSINNGGAISLYDLSRNEPPCWQERIWTATDKIYIGFKLCVNAYNGCFF